MSRVDPSSDPRKYYDPAEVEAYVKDVTDTINALQARFRDLTRRTDASRTALSERPETARPIEVDHHLLAAADAEAADIVQAAEVHAREIIDAANRRARRVIDDAGGAAADVFLSGEARLLAVVSAFREGTDALREVLNQVEADATNWRNAGDSPSPDMG